MPRPRANVERRSTSLSPLSEGPETTNAGRGARAGGSGGTGGQGGSPAKKSRRNEADLEADFGSDPRFERVDGPDEMAGEDEEDLRCVRCREADIPCFKPKRGKTKKRRCASCTTGGCSLFGKGRVRSDAPVIEVEEGEAKVAARETLVVVRRMRTRCEASLVYAVGADKKTLEALLADAKEAEAKLGVV